MVYLEIYLMVAVISYAVVYCLLMWISNHSEDIMNQLRATMLAKQMKKSLLYWCLVSPIALFVMVVDIILHLITKIITYLIEGDE